MLHCFSFCCNYRFIASSLPELASIALRFNKKIVTQRSYEEMICIGNFKKILYFCNFHSNIKKLHHFCFYMCQKVLFCFMAKSDEALKRGDEALNAHCFNFEDMLNPSSLHSYDYSALNTSSPLPF